MSRILKETILFCIFSVATVAQGAEFELHPSLAVSEEFTDNVFETRLNRTSDYITRTLPGLALIYKAPALNADVGYLFDYRHYAKKKRDDEITHSLSAKGLLTAVEDFIYLDVGDEYQRVSLDVTRDVARESLFLNQSDRNVVTVSPYLILHPTQRISARPGYRFIDTRYFSSTGIDKTDHVGFLDMTYELMKSWSLTAAYSFTRELAVVDNFSEQQALGGFRYEYAQMSFLFAQAGNTWVKYDSGHALSSILWNAGITHVFDSVTATITTGVRYNEDPLRNVVQESFISGILEKRFKRGSLSFSPMYSEYVMTESDALQTKKYGATAQGRYEISQELEGRFAFTAEKYEQPLLGSYTRRYQVDSGLSYLLASQLTASLSYIYVDYYSPGIALDNRHVNRGIIEIRKAF